MISARRVSSQGLDEREHVRVKLIPAVRSG
jgi:hypothetical protein